MKIAICVKGLFDHTLESFYNINENVFKALKNENHEIKTFVVSQLDETFSLLAISEKIKPEKIWLNQDRKSQRYTAMWGTVPLQLLDCCKIVKAYEEENDYSFDAILIIRMDVLFNKPITQENIDYSKVNMECMFVPDMNSGDNIFWIPKMYFNQTYSAFAKIIEEKNNSHQAWIYLEKENVPLHYIGGETSKRNPEYDVVIRFTRYHV
jgi:hypothetical protein